MKGKIILIPFPFTDLTTAKLRPALVLYEGKRDVVVAFISSKLPSESSQMDVIIDRSHPEFKSSGLKATSVIRLDKIATISKTMILGELGEAGNEVKREVNKRLLATYILDV